MRFGCELYLHPKTSFSLFLEKEAFVFRAAFSGSSRATPALKIGSGGCRDAIQARDYCVAKNATLRADRSGPSAGEERPPQDDKPGALLPEKESE
ncbi:MAG: hypothetical protein ACLQBK_22540 [Candidatus Sulfotelmatobacter sp.]